MSLANYMYLYTTDSVPDDDFKYTKEHVSLVADVKWCTPPGFYLLMQDKPVLSKSFIWNDNDGNKYNAITAKYSTKNVDTFIKYLRALNKNSNKDGSETIDKIEKCLKDSSKMRAYFHLETAEIACMDSTAKNAEGINKTIKKEFERIKHKEYIDGIINEIKIAVIDDYLSGCFWELLDKSNSSVSGFTKSAQSLKNKNGKILLVKENTAMANIDGLFNLAAFESAKENDILGMNINETAEFKDHCPSMDPEQHFDADNSGNKTIPVPGGDKEEPKTDAKEVEIPVPGGDKEKPDAKPADGETSVPAAAKAVLDDSTYNAALDNLQKSFKEAVEVIDMIKNSERVHESVEDQYKKFMESAMDNAFMDWTYGPLFEKVTLADKDDIKKFIKDNSSKVAKFVDDQRADYTFYKPHTFARFILTFGADLKAWQHILSTKMWQVLGCVTCEEANIQTLTKAMTEEFKDELGEYKVIAFKAFPSFVDVWRMKFNFQNQLNVWFLIIDKKLPVEFKKAEEAAAKEEKAEETSPLPTRFSNRPSTSPPTWTN